MNLSDYTGENPETVSLRRGAMMQLCTCIKTGYFDWSNQKENYCELSCLFCDETPALKTNGSFDESIQASHKQQLLRLISTVEKS